MRISLIGMSGSGKSYWSKKFQERGFTCYCCDDMIAEKLIPELTQEDGSIAEVGEWMGFPYEQRYHEREAQYLNLEIEVLTDIYDMLSKNHHDHARNVVIDTTGSVIYAGNSVLQKLHCYTTFVHLATPPDIMQQMLQAYITHQRPVVWNSLFQKKSSETNEQAMARCYPLLLSSREQLYIQHADITIDYYWRISPHVDVNDMIEQISA